MRIRKFQADTVREALLMVKEEMGPEAVILRTQKLKGSLLGGGERYEVTAGLEERFYAAPEPVPPQSAAQSFPQASATASGPAYGPGSRRPPAPGPVREPTRGTGAAGGLPGGAPGAPGFGGGAYAPPGPPSGSAGSGISRDEFLALQEGIAAVRQAAQAPRDELAAVRREMGELRSVIGALAENWREQSQLPLRDAVIPLYQKLVQSDFSEALAREICEDVQGRLQPGAEDNPEWVRGILLRALAARFPCAPALSGTARSKPRIVLFTGPTGVGKTTTIMKLAVRLSLQSGLRIGMISCDSYRIGAEAQIRTFSDVAHLPLRLVFTDDDLSTALSELSDRDAILVDTAGRSLRNRIHHLELATLVARLAPDEIHLVQSATTRLRDLRASLAAYRDLGPNRLVFTKLDETESYGALCTLIAEEKIPVSLLCFGQEIPDHMSDASPEEMARMALGDEVGEAA